MSDESIPYSESLQHREFTCDECGEEFEYDAKRAKGYVDSSSGKTLCEECYAPIREMKRERAFAAYDASRK